MPARNQFQLDHVILLVPYRDLTDPPVWLKDNFILSPGGRHADNRTENRLVLFADGTYLEIIAFIDDDPERRRGHWWDKPFGVVDYALTTASDDPIDHDAVAARLEHSETGISYAAPQEGGRTRPDGAVLQWRVTFPRGGPRGAVPFFCEDITPRQRRVPLSPTATAHPCGARGMAGVRIEVKSSENQDRFSRATAAVVQASESSDGGSYEIRMPEATEGLKSPVVRLNEATDDASVDLQLALVLQTGKQEGSKQIREEIDGGLVLIEIE